MILKGKRIFVVEDDARNKTIVQMLLERAGAIVTCERWVPAIMQNLKAFSPVDAILLDLMLPNNTTGYDVFKQIREQQEFNNVPIIAVSASDPSEAIPRTQDLGFAGFIAKPVDFHRFAQSVAECMAGQSVWDTPSQL